MWDRARQTAREEIVDAALRLFEQRGFDETPISQIAEEAGVSERTLFRYFGTKQDLLGDDPGRFGDVLEEAVRTRPDDEDVWAALRAGIAAMVAVSDEPARALTRFRLIHGTPSLRAGWLEKRMQMQERVLPLIQARIDPDSDRAELRARAIVAAAFACLEAASIAWVQSNGSGELLDLYDACVAIVRN